MGRCRDDARVTRIPSGRAAETVSGEAGHAAVPARKRHAPPSHPLSGAHAPLSDAYAQAAPSPAAQVEIPLLPLDDLAGDVDDGGENVTAEPLIAR